MKGIENIVGLFGMPRSGTTLLARIIGSHSRVSVIYEPWQQHRHEKFENTNVEKLCSIANIKLGVPQSILIKETTTRAINTKLLLRTLEEHQERVNPAAIIILRSPIEVLLSQSVAAKNLWGVGDVATEGERATRFLSNQMGKLSHVIRDLDFCNVRVVSYHQLLKFPELIIKSLMTLFPYQFEQKQIEFYLEKQRNKGGDPEVFVDPKPIDLERTKKYEKAIQNFKDNHRKSRIADVAINVHNAISEISNYNSPLNLDNANVHYITEIMSEVASINQIHKLQ